MNKNYYLITAGLLSFTASLLHLACIYFGASWYRFFGAGEQMALMAEQGDSYPTLVTLAISAVLFTWSLYALSAAGVIKRLPLIKTALVAITSVYLVRGAAGFAFVSEPIGRSPEFWVWSSAICFVIGIIHMIGLKKQWHKLI